MPPASASTMPPASASTMPPTSAVVSTTSSPLRKCNVTLAATTSSFKWADTGAVIKASFLVGAKWDTDQFFKGSQIGKKESKTFELEANPTKVRLFMGDSEDGWGFREVQISTPDGKITCTLATGQGAEYGDNLGGSTLTGQRQCCESF